MLIHDIAKASLDWLAEADLLPRHRESGTFTPRVSGSQSFVVGEPQQVLMHYAQLAGPLYSNLTAWGQARRVVAGFIADTRESPSWTPQSPFITGNRLLPSEVLDQATSALAGLGLSLIDRNNHRGSALFRAEETCRILDLPEPYGKWFQHRDSKPCWADTQVLRLDVRCTIATLRTGPGAGMPPGTLAAGLRVEISALAPSVAQHLYAALTPLMLPSQLVTQRAIAVLFVPSARAWLNG